jgi:hypothetical protein
MGKRKREHREAVRKGQESRWRDKQMLEDLDRAAQDYGGELVAAMIKEYYEEEE